MRWSSIVLLTAIGAAAGAQAPVRPAPTDVSGIEKRSKEHAVKLAAERAGRVAATTLGYLNSDAAQAIRRWDEAVRHWKDERRREAAPLLAEGVLFDCLARMHGIVTPVLSSEHAVPFFADLAATRPGRAVKAFAAALKVDPQLTEARLRAARIRASDDRSAALALEQMANEPDAFPYSYLAAISRAESARAADDRGSAAYWYRRVLELEPGSPAAAIGLSSLEGKPVPFNRLDPSDIYYSYPCTVLTPDIAAALSARVKREVVK